MKDIQQNILDSINQVSSVYKKPFFLYDGDGIVASHQELCQYAEGTNFQQYFAVKSLPHVAILSILNQIGSGFDCASLTELEIASRHSLGPLMFTANGLSREVLSAALSLGAEITLDDEEAISLLGSRIPNRVSIRVHFGGGEDGNVVGGSRPKFGVPVARVYSCIDKLKRLGVQTFGLHCMESANSTSYTSKSQEAIKLIQLASEIDSKFAPISLLNFGGGIGIPYRPDETSFDLDTYFKTIKSALAKHFKKPPQIVMECGRSISGPHGYLVGHVVGVYSKPHPIISLDITTSMMPRVMTYSDAYHHISVLGYKSPIIRNYDVVGSMCESADKFAVKRSLHTPAIGDTCIVHDTGAHCISMSNTYNGFLRPAEFLLYQGEVFKISREETTDDFVARFVFEKFGYGERTA